MKPKPGSTYVCTKGHDHHRGNLHEGELWKVEMVDSDGDIHMTMVLEVPESSNHRGHKQYFKTNDFQMVFSPVGRKERAEELCSEIEERRREMESHAMNMERKEAKLSLMRRYGTDDEEAHAIWNAIRTYGDDVELVLRALGLKGVVEVEIER